MKFSELLELATECIKTYNPIYKTVDSHADEFLSAVSNIPSLTLECAVERSVRKSVRKAGVLWMCALRGLFKNFQPGVLLAAFLSEPERYEHVRYLRVLVFLQT